MADKMCDYCKMNPPVRRAVTDKSKVVCKECWQQDFTASRKKVGAEPPKEPEVKKEEVKEAAPTAKAEEAKKKGGRPPVKKAEEVKPEPAPVVEKAEEPKKRGRPPIKKAEETKPEPTPVKEEPKKKGRPPIKKTEEKEAKPKKERKAAIPRTPVKEGEGWCPCCQKALPLSEFGERKMKNKKDGTVTVRRQSYCRKCRNTASGKKA